MLTAVRESLTSQQNTGEVIQVIEGEVIQLKGNKTSTYFHGNFADPHYQKVTVTNK